MKITGRSIVFGLMAVAALSVTACAKKYEVAAGQSQAVNKELAVTQRSPDNTLAYEHEVSLEVDRDQIAKRVDATRAACTADTKSACTILEVSVNDGEIYANGRVKMRLALSGVAGA